MKIVMLCDLYDETLQYQENLLAKYYAKHGHQVTILAATFNNVADYWANRYHKHDPGRTYRDGMATVIKLPYSMNFLGKLRRLKGVAAILERERPDLIFVHDIHLNLLEATRYKRSNPTCRIIMDYHADYNNSARNWLSLNILHRVIRRGFLYRHRDFISRIYPVYPHSGTFLHEVYGLPLQDLELLPLGADTDLARATRLDRAGAAVRARFGIPDDAIVVFTGGKLSPAKKTDLLVEAVLQIGDSNLHLLIVGDIDPTDVRYKRRLAALCACRPRVHLAGWVDGPEVYKFMDACDFAVFPASQSVLWPQALSMGLPLVVGRAAGQDYSFMNFHGNMIVLDEDDIRSDVIAEKIRCLAGDRALLRERQAAALKAADEVFSYDKIVLRTLSDG